MYYQELRILLPSDQADALSDALMDCGALSSAIEDAQAGTEHEQAIFGEPGLETGIWEQSLVLSLFDSDSRVEDCLQEACRQLNMTVPAYEINQLPTQDWVRLTQAQFDPIRISDRLWIVPSWHEAPMAQAINIRLDPGLAFGTGSHPTTRLCLEWLDRHLQPDERVLDYGCGSGILAIAALKLGAAQADGVDVDTQAIQSAQDNAKNNGVTAHFYLPEQAPEQTYDVVVANILSNPLRMLSALLAARCRTGGRIVLSGILAEQAEEISAIYAQYFEMDKPCVHDVWVALSGVKR